MVDTVDSIFTEFEIHRGIRPRIEALIESAYNLGYHQGQTYGWVEAMESDLLPDPTVDLQNYGGCETD